MPTAAVTANPNMQPHPVAPQFRYNVSQRKFIDNQGRFVPAKAVRQAVDTVITGANQGIQKLALQLQAGEINLAKWQMQTMHQTKLLHMANGLAGLGGSQQASQADLGYMGSLIKKQYAYLQGFAEDIASGRQLLTGSFLARVKLYSEAARGSFESVKVRAARLGGVTLAKRELGISDSCPGCLEQAAKGWQPIMEVAPIGSQQCLSNCHCQIVTE
jgi:hypothetical protein